MTAPTMSSGPPHRPAGTVAAAVADPLPGREAGFMGVSKTPGAIALIRKVVLLAFET